MITIGNYQKEITLDQLIDMAEKGVRQIWQHTHAILPIYHFVTEDGTHKIFSPSPIDKDAMVAAVKQLFIEEKAVAYVFISEAWSFRPPKDTKPEDLPASLERVPGRREIVMLLAENSHGLKSGEMEITRPDGTDAVLGDIEYIPSDGVRSEGRMIGLLPSKPLSS